MHSRSTPPLALPGGPSKRTSKRDLVTKLRRMHAPLRYRPSCFARSHCLSLACQDQARPVSSRRLAKRATRCEHSGSAPGGRDAIRIVGRSIRMDVCVRCASYISPLYTLTPRGQRECRQRCPNRDGWWPGGAGGSAAEKARDSRKEESTSRSSSPPHANTTTSLSRVLRRPMCPFLDQHTSTHTPLS